MKFYWFIILLATTAWGGWYASEESIKEGIEGAQAHPLTKCNGAVLGRGHVKGSAVVVNKDWIVTAAHVLGNFKTNGVQDLQDACYFSHDGTMREEVYRVRGNYIFSSQDLAFLKLETSLPPDCVSPIIPFDLHQSLVKEWKSKPPVADQGNPATFFGCGDKIGIESLEGKKREYVAAIQHVDLPSDRGKLTKHFGEKAVGQCHLSQYFGPDVHEGSCFFSWMDTKGKKGNSALPGDSGGGMFIEKEASAYLGGVVSHIYTGSEWDTRGKRYVGTSFATLYSPAHEGGKESYLETVLRLAD